MWSWQCERHRVSLIIVHCCSPPLSQQEQRHLCVIYNGGINWTDRDGTDLGITVYSAVDDLSGISRVMVDSATNETYKWAEEAVRPEGGLHQQPSTNTHFFGNSKQLPPVSK